MTEKTEVLVFDANEVKSTRTLKIEVDLTDEVIDGLVDTAGYGIGYWAVYADVDTEAKTYTIRPDPPTVDGETIKREYVLTWDRLRDAIVELWDADKLPDWFVQEIRDDDICGDATVGDLIVQQAAFSEVIFG